MAVGLLGKANLLSQRFLSFSDSSSSKKTSSLSSSLKLQPLHSSFHGNPIALQQTGRKTQRASPQAVPVQMSLCIGKAQRWWQKGVQPNMKEITSAQDLHESLLNAGDKLVIVDFFSPGCGGCKALHPKICQFAEMNPDIQFLQVNHEEHKSMCYSLHVHVLPFFRFYRGAHGRLCSFSCTNATIKKFRDALAKHTTDRCSLEPPKGLEESERIALAANKDLNFNYVPKPEIQQPVAKPALEKLDIPLPSPSSVPIKEFEKTLVASSRR